MIALLTQLFAADCSSSGDPNFLIFPTWYHYLHRTNINGLCSPQLSSLSDIWLVIAAVIEILLRVAALVAVVFVIWGAVTYITSQGEPDATNRARSTITDALIGLLISISAAALVAFIAGSIS